MADAISVKDAGNQTVEVATNDAVIAKLAELLAKLSDDPATQTGLTAIVDALGGTLGVSADALPLPAGAATGAKQDTNTAAVNLVGTRAYDWANGQVVDIGASSVPSDAIAASEVLFSADVDCWINVGATPVASVGANSLFLPAGLPFHCRISSGQKVAVIQASDAGKLSILPVA